MLTQSIWNRQSCGVWLLKRTMGLRWRSATLSSGQEDDEGDETMTNPSFVGEDKETPGGLKEQRREGQRRLWVFATLLFSLFLFLLGVLPWNFLHPFRLEQRTWHRGEEIVERVDDEAPDRPLPQIPSKTAQQFYAKHCEMQHPNIDWWPPEQMAGRNWKLRTPSFLLIGAKKAGTTTLWSWLQGQMWKTADSSTITIVKARKKELLFFNPWIFPAQFWKGSMSGKVQVDQTRRVLWNFTNHAMSVVQEDSKTTTADISSTSSWPTKNRNYPYYSAWLMLHKPRAITFEATPDYLFYSNISMVPILCTFPWVKLLVVLRDPIARTNSEHNFNQQVGNVRRGEVPQEIVPLLHKDWKRLQETGVSTAEPSSPEERQAWWSYQQEVQRNPKGALIGRSLYVLQLEEWYEALRTLGRDPSQQLLVVRTEDMKLRPEQVVEEILAWLGRGWGDSPNGSKNTRSNPKEQNHWSQPHSSLPSITRLPGSFRNSSAFESRFMTEYQAPPISNETYEWLRRLYEPYNQRLYDLLGWGPDKQWNTY